MITDRKVPGKMIKQFENKKFWRITGTIITTVLYLILVYHFCRKYVVDNSASMLIRRIIYSAIIYVFAISHFFVDVRKMYENIFRYRLVIALALFIFLVANNINFSSINQYDQYVQPGMGDDYVAPVFGKSRSIRSDEWLVNISRMMSGSYNHFGATNHILRGTVADNLSASGFESGYWALAIPSSWGYYFFGSSHGLSYAWSFNMVFGFLAAFELVYILCGDKNISLLGAVLIHFSPFNLWWSMVSQLMAGNAAIALFYHFISENKKYKKAVYGFFTAIFLADFVVVLYPAWQVTFGYLYLFILIWIIIKEKDKWKKSRVSDWCLALICFAFFVSIAVSYLFKIMPYMKAVMATAYPGHRQDCGGNSLNILFGYLTSSLDSIKQRSNPCEPATFFSLFPLGIILAVYIEIRKKGKDILIWLLMVPTLLLTWYCTTGLPYSVAKITLMTYSTSGRAVAVLAYVGLMLLLYSLSCIREYKMPFSVAAIITIAVLIPALIVSENDAEMTRAEFICVIAECIVVFIVVSLLMSKKRYEQWQTGKNILFGISSVLMLVLGLQINPVQIGTDAITSKPAAKEIRSIVKEDGDAKWIATGNFILPDFLVANGASTYNSVNYIPNMSFWKKLDVNGEFDEVYNRYAHVLINMTDEPTTMTLAQEDLISLNLSYNDLSMMNVKYIASSVPLENNKVSLIYDDNGTYIYSVNNTEEG